MDSALGTVSRSWKKRTSGDDSTSILKNRLILGFSNYLADSTIDTFPDSDYDDRDDAENDIDDDDEAGLAFAAHLRTDSGDPDDDDDENDVDAAALDDGHDDDDDGCDSDSG